MKVSFSLNRAAVFLVVCGGVGGDLAAQAPTPVSGAKACVRPAVIDDELFSEPELGRMAELLGITNTTPRIISRAAPDVLEIPCNTVTPEVLRLRLRAGVLAGESGAELLPFRSLVTYNSDYARDRDNGALWSGRGVSGIVSGGAAVRFGKISAVLSPTFLYEQNREFQTARSNASGVSPFSNPFYPYSIDLPARFGDKPISEFGVGPSYIRVDAGSFAAGVSNENVR